MGAKQSKRSVDISGKEAESAGEVAAAGAGGEGRLEAIADGDLKPQLNGDAQHITPPDELTDKEKQLDSGTPENEKDATTEKDNKEQENVEKAKEATTLTNGEVEKTETEKENTETATPEQEGKKPKKDKALKKKWSLRSISFSRKDKPKQEKKQKEKEEEPKTNGDAEKVPEEAAEATAEAVEAKPTESPKAEPEVKEDKTPETPVTEPMTNGSTTPESPKEELKEPVTETSNESRPAVTEPEQLPVNGLSLEEPKAQVESLESKLEETSQPEPVPEIPVKTEVCVEQVPMVETTPPPLPANPPPSSVASFAASNMAPETTDAFTANTVDIIVSALSAIPITESKEINKLTSAPQNLLAPVSEIESENLNDVTDIVTVPECSLSQEVQDIQKAEVSENIDIKSVEASNIVAIDTKTSISEVEQESTSETIPEVQNGLSVESESPIETEQSAENFEDVRIQKTVETVLEVSNNLETEVNSIISNDLEPETQPIAKVDSIEELPPPISEELSEKTDVDNTETNTSIVNSNYISDDIKLNNINGNDDLIDTNIADREVIECNGNLEDEKTKDFKAEMILPPSPCEEESQNMDSESFPLPPSDLCPTEPDSSPTQDIPVHDKIADLIPEVPELPTETLQETVSDVAVAN